jgi:uncharacterized membrane protein
MKNERLDKALAVARTHTPSVALSAICGWLLSLTIFSGISEFRFTAVPDFANSISTVLFLICVAVVSALIFAAHKFLSDKIIPLALPAFFTIYGISSVANTAGDAHAKAYTALVFTILSLAVIALVANFLKSDGIKLPTKDISARTSFIIVTVAFAAISAYFIVVLGSRTAAYCSPCYDMGIFAQMYDNMTETFLPYTTCERGEHLSHFAVHFSPVLYLLLPFCYIFKPTDVLVWGQILVVFSGVFPLWLICRRVKLSNFKSTIVSLLFLLYPAMSSGAFYDFHENAFLAPLILWTLYFIHAEKWIPTFIFALGVLTVKEDAAMYVGFIALYVIFARKKIVKGLLLFAMTFAYFLFAMWMLMQGSEGIMLGSRYFNIIGYDGGFVDLIKVALVNPALYAAESFTYEKLLYALNMLVPIAFLPLMTRKPSRWLLIAPLFVINLISDYQYQYNLTFQYSFGSGAMLIYAAAINLADLSSSPEESTDELTKCEKDEQNDAEIPTSASAHKCFRSGAVAAILTVAMMASLFLGAARAPSQFFYVERVLAEKETYNTVEDVLSRIDRTKSVMATSMYLTHLYDVDELYHTSQALEPRKSVSTNKIVTYQILIPTDIVVLDLRSYVSDSSNAEMWEKVYREAGYEVTERHDGIILVMEKKN